ncbi:MAG: thiamine phosphate synthase [Breznakibacter sp.]
MAGLPNPIVVAITLPVFLEREHEAVHALLDNGAHYVHIRKPEAIDRKMESYLDRIDVSVRERLTLHYHHELAVGFGLGGIHESRDAIGTMDGHYRRSKSCHSVEEVVVHSERFDYLFLSPIFESISKAGYHAAFGHCGLRKILKHPENPLGNVVALGGVCAGNARLAREMGFAGIALLGGLWVTDGIAVDVDRSVEQLKLITKAWNDRSY